MNSGWIVPKRDRAFLAGQLQDYHARTIAPGVLLVPSLPSGNTYNTLYQEETTYNEALRRGNHYEISVKVLAPPSPKILKKYGIDQHRSIQLSFPVDAMKKLGFSKVEVGWVFIYLNETYRITEFYPEAYTDHYDSFLYWVSFAVKQRFSSIESDPILILSPTADTTFGGKRDARFLSQQSGLFHRRAIPNVLLFERPSDLDIDVLYGEEFPDFFTWNRYTAPFYTSWQPQDFKYKKEGVEETRTIRFSISNSAFEKLNVPIPTVGSVFVIEGEFYRINDQHPVSYIGTTGSYAITTGSAWKAKPSSLPGAFNPATLLFTPNKNTLLLPIQDVSFLAAGQADLFRRAFGTVSFYIRDRAFTTKTILDSKGLVHPERFREELRSAPPTLDLLYNEDVGEYRIPGTQIDLPAYVRVNPPKWTLRKFGLDTDRDIMVWLSIGLLDQLGFEVLPNYGDIFVFENEYYHTTDQTPAYYFSNTERYVAIACFGRKLRQSSLDTAPLIPLVPQTESGYTRDKGKLDGFSDPPLVDDLYHEPLPGRG